MKLNKKKVFALALAVCLIATLSMGSLAWFTAEDSVTNNFLVGDSTTDPDDVFGIDVWETVDGDEYGKGTGNDKGAEYEAILPGEVLNKEPVLTNTGIHPQFVRAIVTVSDAYILREAMMGNWGNADLFLAGTDTAYWTLEDILYTTDDELVYIYYYNTELAAGATTEPIFTDIVIPTGLTLEQAQAMEDFSVTILGQVIQSEHLADPDAPGQMVTTAQRAFELYWDAKGTIAGYTDEEINANAKINGDTTTDVYVTIDANSPSNEVSLTNETISVSGSVIKIAANLPNNNVTIIIDSCALTIADGGYVVEFEAAGGGNVVYISSNTTINGKAIGDMTEAEAAQYFHNIDIGMVWVDGVPGNWA